MQFCIITWFQIPANVDCASIKKLIDPRLQTNWTDANRPSDVRRWEIRRNGGVSEGPWSFHRLVIQAIATMRPHLDYAIQASFPYLQKDI